MEVDMQDYILLGVDIQDFVEDNLHNQIKKKNKILHLDRVFILN